jgi:hypothetical protein
MTKKTETARPRYRARRSGIAGRFVVIELKSGRLQKVVGDYPTELEAKATAAKLENEARV